jgi:uncharacterized damage-inducible protein DinB
MQKTYRLGAIGALLDEYERSISDLRKVIESIPEIALTIIVDPDTNDENCRSVQTVLTHIVHSGYGYATSIHNLKGQPQTRPGKIFRLTIREYQDDLTDMFKFTENIFGEFKDEELEQFDNALKIKTGWGQFYDVEQLTEHAIVHILRHRRQIEKFKIKLVNTG